MADVKRLWVVVAGALLLASVANLAWATVQALQGRAVDYWLVAGAGRMFADGNGAQLYSYPQEVAAQAEILGYLPHFTQFLYPPLLGWLAQPFAHLSVATGLSLYLSLSAVLMVLAAWLLVRAYAANLEPLKSVVLVSLTVLSLPSAVVLLLGQTDAFIGLALALGLVAMRRDNPWFAGLLFSLAAIKPQLIWALPVAFVTIRDWRMLSGFAVGTAVWLISTLAFTGTAFFSALLTANGTLIHASNQNQFDSLGIPGLIGTVTGNSTVEGIAATVGVALTIAAFWLIRKRCLARPDLAIALAIFASFTFATYSHDYDLLALAPAFFAWARYRPDQAILGAVFIDGSWLADHIVNHFTHINGLVLLAATILVLFDLSIGAEETPIPHVSVLPRRA